LCARCQELDIESSTRAGGKRNGYLLTDVRAAADQAYQFCSLLSDALEAVEKPKYFYNNAFMGRTTLTPELYVHTTIPENYKEEVLATPSGGLRANRFFVELGDRFSGMRDPPNHTACIAADPNRYLHAAFSRLKRMPS
jgi:hypothetical protein